MHFADSIVIFVLALILFGPKKLPEIAKQIGKLMVEFRRASNEFKAQIDDELRTMEQQERQKKLEEATATLPALDISAQPSILPPSTGEAVAASHPYGAVTPPELPAETVATEATSPAVETVSTNGNGHGTYGHPATAAIEPENVQAPIHHG